MRVTPRLARLGPRWSPSAEAKLVAVVAVASLALFAFAFLVHPDRPGNHPSDPRGWYGFYDQRFYLGLANRLADLDLPSPSSYIYGLGYPALAVPFLWLRPAGDAFAVPDGLAFGAAMAMVALLGARLRSVRFGLGAAAATALATPLLELMVVPWNTTVTVVAVLAALVVATNPGPLTWRGATVIGLATGAAFAARYVDAAFPAAIGLVALRRAGPVRTTFLTWLTAGAAAAAVAVPVLVTHAAVLDSPWRTPYAVQEGAGGVGTNQQSLSNMDVGDIPRHFVDTFVIGDVDGERRDYADPLLRRFPWALLAPLGAVALLVRRHRLRVPFLVALGVSAAGTLFYLAYPGSDGAQLRFGNLHYWKCWFPLWALLGAYAVAVVADRLTGRKEETSAP
ncbi:MAG: hypothetical protein ACRDY7_02030 [Acidimicrobiia bacterium]